MLVVKRKITAVLTVVLMLLMQVPFSVFAAEITYTDTADIRAELLRPDALSDGRVDVRYNEEFNYDYSEFNGGYNQYGWNIIDGELPPGLALYPDSGPTWKPWINGTPTKAGTYTFTIEGGNTEYKNGENVYVIAARKTYTLKILPAYPLEISNYALYNGCENQSYSVTFEESQYRTVSWSMQLSDGGALPDGLSLNAESGKLTWEKPAVGKYNLKITATRDDESVSKVLKLIIEPGDGCEHTTTTKTTRTAATCKENGMADYWYCDVCEGYFLDEDCKRTTSREALDKLYTTAFHSDKNSDGKCDTCKKTMPIFKKVMNDDEITSCGMYLVVSKIGDKYYALKAPENEYTDSVEAIEVMQNSDGTFSYPESDTGVMILKTEFAAMCNELDAGRPRYSFGTTIEGIPYSLTSDDYSGSIQIYPYEKNKYGFRMSLSEDGTPAIASVYSEYWGSGESGKGGDTGILTAFEATKNSTTKQFFSFRTQASYENNGVYTGSGYDFYDDLSTYPIELYKLIYSGTVDGTGYTLSDAQSMVTINNEFTLVDSSESNSLSTAGGISEAVKTSYVESVISAQTDIGGEVSVRTYADINLKSGDGTVDEHDYAHINSLLYSVTPKLELREEASETTYTQEIPDVNFDGSEITLTLCVGNMNPAQVIHHKTDGTKEYFYNEHSKSLKAGQKTFSVDEWGTGNFVTFTIDSFSDIEILATAKAEPITTGNAAVTAPVGGQTPSFTAVSDDSSRYSVEVLQWIDVENNMDITPQDLTNVSSPYYNYKFKPGKQYTAVVRFTAAEGYELSYTNNFTINGQKTNWMGNGLKRTYTFTAEASGTNTVVNGKTFTVTGSHINGCTVILALYKGNQLVDCQSAEYDGNAKTFTTTASDYTSAKVLVWDGFENLKPVTGTEIVNLE